MTTYKIRVPRYEDGVVGLPAAAVAFSNSERGVAACDHRWWLRHAEGLVTSLDRPPLRYGRAWHDYLEDRHRWFLQFDTTYPPGAEHDCAWCAGVGTIALDPCQACGGTGNGPVARAAREWRRLERVGVLEPGAANDDAERLARAIDGYSRLYGRDPMDSFRVVAVELRLAAPVMNPRTGSAYSPHTWVVEDGDGLRLARTHESWTNPTARTVRWPWHQVMTLDAVLASRADPSKLWVYEGKSAKDAERRMLDLLFETQIPGYTWGLRHIAKAGLVDWMPTDARVAGYLFDVASSKLQRDPELKAPAKVKTFGPDGEPIMNGRRYVYELDDDGKPVERSPGFSTARSGKAAGVPSWRFLDGVRREGFSEEHYQEHITHLMTRVDPKLYTRDYPTCGPEVTSRYAREAYAVARRLAGLRRAAATARTRSDIDERFPRTPVCTLPGGTCSLRGPCLQDGEIVRRDYVVAPTVRWELDDDIAQQEDLGW